MNIFWLSIIAKESARMLFDVHVNKMALEATQMLYTALRSAFARRMALGLCNEADVERFFSTAPGTKKNPLARGYASMNPKHPVTLWVGKTRANFRETIEIGRAICEEYAFRYGKEHACVDHIKWMETVVDRCPIEGEEFTEPARAFANFVPPEGGTVVDDYRAYYITKKDLAAYKNGRMPPEFMLPHLSPSQYAQKTAKIAKIHRARRMKKNLV